MNEYYLSTPKLSDNGWKFFVTLALLNQQEELSRLVIWAKRKGHLNPLRLYEYRLVHTQKAFFRAEIEAPRIATCAHTAHMMKKVFFPHPNIIKKVQLVPTNALG